MQQGFLDVAVGDRDAHARDLAAYSRAVEFYAAAAPMYGWDAGAAPDDLDAEAAELLLEAAAADPAWAARGPLALKRPCLEGGRLLIDLAPDAPKAAANFRALLAGDRGVGKASGKPLHYKGVPLHRVVKGFMAQGGDVARGDGSGGDSIYGGKFADEPAGLRLRHDAAGVVGMANSGRNSNTSQFYITFGPAPQLDGKHVVVGRVTSECLAVLRRVEELAASADGVPRTQVFIEDCGVL